MMVSNTAAGTQTTVYTDIRISIGTSKLLVV